MNEFFFSTLSFGLAVGLKPGPLGIVVIQQTLSRGLPSGLRASMAPLITDGPIVIAALWFLSQFKSIDLFAAVLSICGGLYLLLTPLNEPPCTILRREREGAFMRVPANSKLSRVLRSTWMSVATSTLLVTAAAWIGTASVAQAAPPNTMPIWRLQVRFITANVGDANTDDSMKVELNGANRTWLDSGRDDHERNSDETFDLRTEGINTLADIDFFRVEKGGSDGWAIGQIQLLVNDVAI